MSLLFPIRSFEPPADTDFPRYFYQRLRRRLQEEDAIKRLVAADPSLSREAAMEIVEGTVSDVDLKNDQAVVAALEKSSTKIASAVKDARASNISETILAMSDEDSGAVLEGLKRAYGSRLSAEDLAVRFPASPVPPVPVLTSCQPQQTVSRLLA